MGKKVENVVYDAALNYIKNATGLQMILLDEEPGNRAAAVSGALCTFSLSESDVTIADGSSGRKLTIGEKLGGIASAGGVHHHTAVISSTELLFVTTATGKTINNGDEINTPAFSFQLNDPA